MKLYRSEAGCIVEQDNRYYSLGDASCWDELVRRDDLESYLQAEVQQLAAVDMPDSRLLPPIGSQEVWAAGVTYLRSRAARMDEAKNAGGGDFYDRVYNAERPELFFKATANRVVGHLGKVAIRGDASWSVPEPELTLLVSPSGKILGYTAGNDMSSRDIEGENPLYLPQAKVYDRSCALGPGILISSEPLPPSTAIRLEIVREGQMAFAGSTTLSQMKREPAVLVEYLYRDNAFPEGCFLLTGTGIVPPDSFSLRVGDEIRIEIEEVVKLINFVG